MAIVAGVLRGLHEAHEALDDDGRPLGIVHRDVSPQNVLVGTDGVARVLDFGIAKASHRIQTTRAGQLKGKLAYMAPEQLFSETVDRRTDIRAAGIVLWEALVGAPLFYRESEGQTVSAVLEGTVPPASGLARGVPRELDEIIARALATRPDDRFATAREMADAIDAIVGTDPASPQELGSWMSSLHLDVLRVQARMGNDLKRRSSMPPFPIADARLPVAGGSPHDVVTRIVPEIPNDAVTRPHVFAEFERTLIDRQPLPYIEFDRSPSTPSSSAPRRRSPRELVILVVLLLVATSVGVVLGRHVTHVPKLPRLPHLHASFTGTTNGVATTTMSARQDQRHPKTPGNVSSIV